MVDFYGELVGKYTSPIDPMGLWKVWGLRVVDFGNMTCRDDEPVLQYEGLKNCWRWSTLFDCRCFDKDGDEDGGDDMWRWNFCRGVEMSGKQSSQRMVEHMPLVSIRGRDVEGMLFDTFVGLRCCFSLATINFAIDNHHVQFRTHPQKVHCST